MRQAEKLALIHDNYDLFRTDPEEEFQNRIRSGLFFPAESDLAILLNALNRKYFGGDLPDVTIEWSSRMKHAGKCIANDNIIRLGRDYHEHYPEDIVDTLKHEMIHIRLPDHSSRFKEEAKRIGASMYAKNYPGMLRGMKYMYVCPVCNLSYPSRKMHRNRSCGPCSKGKYDSRFKLKFVKRLDDR